MLDKLLSGLNENILQRIQFVKDIDHFDISLHQSAFLGIYANWSSYSILHGRSMLKVLEESSMNVGIYLMNIEH